MPPDLSFLVGQRVQQICIGLYDVQLGFEKASTISFLRKFEFRKGNQDKSILTDSPESSVQLVELLGKVIVNGTIDANETLELEFSCGSRILAYSSSCGDDTYVIWNDCHFISN